MGIISLANTPVLSLVAPAACTAQPAAAALRVCCQGPGRMLLRLCAAAAAAACCPERAPQLLLQCLSPFGPLRWPRLPRLQDVQHTRTQEGATCCLRAGYTCMPYTYTHGHHD